MNRGKSFCVTIHDYYSDKSKQIAKLISENPCLIGHKKPTSQSGRIATQCGLPTVTPLAASCYDSRPED